MFAPNVVMIWGSIFSTGFLMCFYCAFYFDRLVDCFVNWIHVKASACVSVRAVYVYYRFVSVQNELLSLFFRAEG